MDPLYFTLVVLVVYMTALKSISFFAHKRARPDSEDYFLSGRGLGAIALLGTTAASLMSTGTVISTPANFYKFGIEFTWILFFGITSLMILAFGPRLWSLGKSKGYLTPGEMMGDITQSRRVQWAIAIAGITCLLPYAAAQLVAVGKTFSSLTGGAISYEWGLTIAAICMAAYLFFGGARAVVWTDVIQGFIFVVLLIISAFLVVQWAGGWQPMIDNLMIAHPEKAQYQSTSLSFLEKILVYPALFCLPYVWQRMYMAKHPQQIRDTALFMPLVYFVVVVACWIIGTGALVILPELASEDLLIGAIFREYAPYFGAIVLVAAFSAGLSSVDSQLLSAASVITRDFGTKHRSAQKEFQAARLWTLVILVCVYGVSLALESTPVIGLILIAFGLGAVMVPALFASVMIPGVPEAAIFWSVVAGYLVCIFKVLIPEWFPTDAGPVLWSYVGAGLGFGVGYFKDLIGRKIGVIPYAD